MKQYLEKYGDEIDANIALHDLFYKAVVDCTEMVRDFIIDHGLILYGGSAIDFALRACGDKIYSESAIPDLDFYSATNVEHAYDLVEQFYKAGYKDSRVINAAHVGTMRVDIGNKHFVADISYIHKRIFAKLPYIYYNRMKIIHPHFQRIDVHRAMSHPYENAPMEVIFTRLEKDIKRFNMLDKYYPLDVPDKKTKLVQIDDYPMSSIPVGFIAYFLIKKEVEGSGKVAVYNDTLEYIDDDPVVAAKNMKLTDVKMYRPYGSLLPKRVQGILRGKYLVIIYDNKNSLLAVNALKNGSTVANIQFVLSLFMKKYYINDKDPVYLEYYTNSMQLIRDNKDNKLLLPSTFVYGSANINHSKELMLRNLYADIARDPSKKQILPVNWHPSKKDRPIFDAKKYDFLLNDVGQEITSN